MREVVRFFTFLITIVILILSVTACDDGGEVHYLYELDENGDAVITEARYPWMHLSPFGKATIPEYIDGYKVVAIADEAFAYSYIYEVTVPGTVRYIGARAFKGSVLDKIYIPSSVEYIGDGAFCGCGFSDPWMAITLDTANPYYKFENRNLYTADMSTLVYFGDLDKSSFEVPEGVTRIGGYAFADADNLISITLPEGLLEIGECAFWNTGLAQITIPSTVVKIENRAINGMVAEIALPRDLEQIGERVLTAGKVVTLDPENKNFKIENDALLSMDGSVFYQYIGNGESSYSIPSGVEKISAYAFGRKSNDMIVPGTKIDEIIIPESVREIGDNAFYYCMWLDSVTIPEGVVKLGKTCFYSCISLETVYIPSTLDFSLTDGGIQAVFCGVDNAPERIEISPGHAEYKSVDGVVYSQDGKRLILCPGGREDSNYKIENGTEVIAERAFYDCKKIKGVDIPESVLIIEKEAFYNAVGLDDIVIPDSVVEIQEYAFYSCSLKSAYIGSAVEVIGESAFGNFFDNKWTMKVEFANPAGWRCVKDGKGREMNETILSVGYLAGKRINYKYSGYRWEKIA